MQTSSIVDIPFPVYICHDDVFFQSHDVRSALCKTLRNTNADIKNSVDVDLWLGQISVCLICNKSIRKWSVPTWDLAFDCFSRVFHGKIVRHFRTHSELAESGRMNTKHRFGNLRTVNSRVNYRFIFHSENTGFHG